MNWYKRLKFQSNPLDVRPNPELIGHEKAESRLKNHIEKQEICFLNGLTGSGKTSLLLKLQKEMKKHKFVYLDAHDLPKNFNLAAELRKKRSFFDKLRLKNFPSKKPVLIIDEFQATDPNLVLEARAKWEHPSHKKIRSIIISQISKNLKNVAPSFMERLGSRVIMLDTLDFDDMKEMLRMRLYNKKQKINYADKLTDDAMSFVIKCSGGNPRRLLEYTDEIFDFHHRKFGAKNPILMDNYSISYHGAKEILGLDKVYVDGFKHLSERQEILRSVSRPVKRKTVDNFESQYSKIEIRILKYMKSAPKTISQIAKRFKVSESTASRYLSGLRKSGSVLFADKKKNRKRWQIAPGVKRLMVRV